MKAFQVCTDGARYGRICYHETQQGSCKVALPCLAQHANGRFGTAIHRLSWGTLHVLFQGFQNQQVGRSPGDRRTVVGAIKEVVVAISI